MVTRAGAYHTAVALLLIKTVDKVVGAAQLVRAHYLQVFTLQVNLGLILFRQLAMVLQRRFQHHRLQGVVRCVYIEGLRS